MAWAESDLVTAWRALGGRRDAAAWRFVSIGAAGGVRFEAGLKLPDGREAVVAVFPAAAGATGRLPEGQGFDVVPLEADVGSGGGEAIALVRRPEGEIGIFGIMAVDVLRSVERMASRPVGELRLIFIRRVQEWQDFMARGGRRPLTPEKQVGLFGELTMLKALFATDLGIAGAVACWMGPRRAAQDFHVLAGAVEVKSTAATGAFAAKINSIEQLDAERAPLFLGALRFAEADDGRTLPELVADARLAADSVGARQELEASLIFSDYRDDHAPQYGRRLSLAQERCFEVTPAFPCLRRADLSPAITSARYGMDLDRLDAPWVDRSTMFAMLGVARHGA